MAHRQNLEETKLIKLLDDTMAYLTRIRGYTKTEILPNGTRRIIRVDYGDRVMSRDQFGADESTMTTDAYLYRLLFMTKHHLQHERKELMRYHYPTMSAKHFRYLTRLTFERLRDMGIIDGEWDDGNQNA